MKQPNTVRRNLKKARTQCDETALLAVVEELLDSHLQLMDRVAELEKAAGHRAPGDRPARQGTPGRRPAVNKDVAGRGTGEPRRTERPTGRSNRKTTDMDRGII
jgi:hypothetical protein